MFLTYLLRLWYQIILDGCFFVVVVVTEWRTTLERLTAAKNRYRVSQRKKWDMGVNFFFSVQCTCSEPFLKKIISVTSYYC